MIINAAAKIDFQRFLDNKGCDSDTPGKFSPCCDKDVCFYEACKRQTCHFHNICQTLTRKRVN